MRLWRVSITGGAYERPMGTAIVWAEDAKTAAQAVESELAGETASGRPFVTAEVELYESSEPSVVLINWE